jgi:hypothetical protein
MTVQVFFAHLSMATLSGRPTHQICHDTTDQLTIANSIAFHTISLFLQDAKDLVTAHVKKGISTQIKSDLRFISSHGKARRTALNAWNKSDQPLSWSSQDSHTGGGYAQLMTILNSDPSSPATALQTSPVQCSYSEIASLLYGISVKKQTMAPVWRYGIFFPALLLAVGRIKRTLPPSEGHAPVVSVLAKMLRRMKIHFIPWHKCDRKDTRAFAVHPEWWLMVKATPAADINRCLPKAPEKANEEAAERIKCADPSAPWELPTKLQEMGLLWNKYLLPTDWSLDAASLPSSNPAKANHYVKETYEYVESHYDGSIWWHHMSFVWGYLFSKMVPYVFLDRGCIDLHHGPLDDQIHSLPWIRRTSQNHGGCSMPGPFITMVSTTIFALLDANSPLRIRATKNRNALGSHWTSKHGK